MSSPGCEALIKLTPLDASNELPRVFALNPVTEHIDVGRASKNESKGLVAAKENAWFDSPIMSRQHARFTVSTAHKGVCLHDNGSTHGTSVGGRRLQPQIDYTLSNDEIITFGVRVTSGELSYPAREFRFNFEWRPWSPESPVFNTTQNKSECIRFQVPDEENDSFSDESCEDSVQILDSHVRAFSVPSSDDELDSEDDNDDDEEIPSSMPQRDEVEKPVTPTTPQRPASENLGTSPEDPIEVWAEPTPAEDLELVGPSKARLYTRLGKFGRVGTSGVNPIDVEARFTDRRVVIGSDGEDEAPSMYSPKSDVYSPRPDVYSPRPDTYSPRPDIYSSKQEQPDADKGKPLSAERPHPAPKSFGVPSSSNPVRPVEQSKGHQMALSHDDESDDEPGILRRKPHPLAGSVRDSLQAKSISNSTDDFNDVDEDDYERETCFLMSTVEYPGRSSGSESTSLYPSACRPRVHFDLGDNAPGTSALDNAASRTNWSYRFGSSGMIDVNSDIQIEAHRTTQRPPSPSDAALAKNGSNSTLHDHWPFIRDGQPLPRDHDNPYLRETSQKAGTPWMENFAGSAHHIRDSSFFDVPDPTWPRYDDGPFTSHAQHNNTLPSLPPSYSFRQNSVSTDQMTRKINCVSSQVSMACAIDENRVAESPSPPATTGKTSISIPEEPECRQKGNESHPARLNISDIVNPLADTTRNLKRKADEMSSNAIEEQEMEQAAESLQQPPPLEAESQDLYLDDAQRRDTLISAETNLSQSSSIDLTTVSVQNQEELAGLDDAGPARKKQKTSSSPAISISKFVSGVLVGVAGAVAAFIATIPMSVQEEALQEIARAP